MADKKTIIEKVSGAIQNAQLTSRLGLNFGLGKTFNGKRDMYSVLGYKTELRIEDYFDKYSRQDIAHRVINAFPDAIWKKSPCVKEDENQLENTPFEEAFSEFALKTDLFYYLNRLDKLARIGEYAVMLVGVAGQADLSKPITPISGVKDIIYLQTFNQRNATIQTYDQDVSSQRYGKPTMYLLETGGYSSDRSSYMPRKTLTVHHSRLLHISEGSLENNVIGMPVLMPIMNRLDDLEKIVGGSAEILWLNARGGLNLNAASDTQIKDEASVMKIAEDYVNQLSRILPTQGMDVKTLEMRVQSPIEHVASIVELISGATGIPQRILVGSERGELASSQDENNWLARVQERRDNYCEPRILRPLINMLMKISALPTVEKFEVVWPNLLSFSEKDKAEIGLQRAQMLQAYMAKPGADLIVPPKQFVKEILGLDYREDDIVAEIDAEARQARLDEAEVGRQTAAGEGNGNDSEK